MAATTPISDLVQVSKLDTQFHVNPEYTQHIKYVSGRTTKERGTYREEKWKREKRLGQGGMGVVWLQRCIQGDSNGEVRAVKQVPKIKDSNYYRELEATALFSHAKFEEYFVKSFGWYDDNDSIFITMEYLPDGDLNKYLNSSLSEKEGQDIVFQILKGLRFMHEFGFAHRDLKPANILVASQSPDWWVKIADFGISKRVNEGATALRTQAGTPAFAAPELFGYLQPGDELQDSYTNAIDIWSLGVITFLILTGETIFKDQYRLRQYVAGSFTFPSDVLLAKTTSAQGCEFVKSLIAPKSKDRPGVKDCFHYPWLAGLTGDSENKREDSILISSSNSLDRSDPEPSASWSTQSQPLETQKARISIDALARRISTNTTEPSVPESAISSHWHIRKRLEGHKTWVFAVAFSPDGKQIASASKDETIKLWDLSTYALCGTLNHREIVTNIAFSLDGKQIVSTSKNRKFWFWDLNTQVCHNSFEGHKDWISAIAFSPDGKQIASASHDETIKLWDFGTAAQCGTLQGHRNWVFALAFSPDGKQIASASRDKTVRLWDLGTWAHTRTFGGHEASVTAVAFSPDGKQIASASWDKTIRLWDSDTGAYRGTLEGHKDGVNAVVFSPDGKQIASASRDKTVRLWDPTTKKHCSTLAGHRDWVEAVAFSPDGKQMASASWKTITLWGLTAPDTTETVMPTREKAISKYIGKLFK